MTSSTPFGRRGVQPPRTWATAAAPTDNEPFERTARQGGAAKAARPKKPPRVSDDASPGLIWLLFSFKGRIRRTQYWLATIAMNTLALGCFGVILWQAGMDGLKSAEGGGLLLPLSLPMAWIGLALTVKRWHDRDRSWLWIFLGFIPIVGPIWAFIECCLLDGTSGPNRFGPSPKGVGGGASMDLSAYGIV